MAKPGRKLDRKQTNRREKHELDARVRKYRMTPKLGVILLDMLCSSTFLGSPVAILKEARENLRRANRAARKAGKRG